MFFRRFKGRFLFVSAIPNSCSNGFIARLNVGISVGISLGVHLKCIWSQSLKLWHTFWARHLSVDPSLLFFEAKVCWHIHRTQWALDMSVGNTWAIVRSIARVRRIFCTNWKDFNVLVQFVETVGSRGARSHWSYWSHRDELSFAGLLVTAYAENPLNKSEVSIFFKCLIPLAIDTQWSPTLRAT